jgi:hypothetical protein
MSYKITETYINKKPKTLEFELISRDSDKNEDITYIVHISNLSFKSSIYFRHLLDQNKFSVRKIRTKTNKQLFNELDNLCSTIKNHQFELTKIFDLEFPSKYEKKIAQCYNSSDDKFYNQIACVSNNYYLNYLSRENDIINYYKDKRLRFLRKTKMQKIENYITAN